MKKEVITAIIVGIVLGLIVMFGVHTAQKSLRERDRSQVSTTANSPANADEGATAHSISINTPLNNAVVDADPLTIIGTTSPDASVALLTDTQSTTTIADSQGNFSAKISLNAGPNVIKVHSYSTNGESADTLIHVVFSTASLEAPEPTATPKAGVKNE